MKKFLALALLAFTLPTLAQSPAPAPVKAPVVTEAQREHIKDLIIEDQGLTNQFYQLQQYLTTIQDKQKKADEAVSEAYTELTKGVDASKWTLNRKTFEFEPVPGGKK